MTLFWTGLGLFVGGFIVNCIGVAMRRTEPGLEAASSWMDFIGKAISGMFTALPKALGNYPLPIKIQSFGSALTYLGLVVILVALMNSTGQNGGNGASPSPSA